MGMVCRIFAYETWRVIGGSTYDPGKGERRAHSLKNLRVDHVIGPEGNAGADDETTEEPDAKWHAQDRCAKHLGKP